MTSQAIAIEPPRDDRLEQIGAAALIGVAGALQFSIAVAQILLTLAAVAWLAVVIVRHERFDVPRFFWPLAVYAALTLVSATLSVDPRASIVDSKQLVLFLIVPIAYRFAGAARGSTLMTVVISCAAASAAVGLTQYGILHYDNLGQRPQGTLGHYMTYSGLLMLVIAVALARVLFATHDRLWAALVIPALAVAVAVTFSRSAAVGVCAAAALLFALRDLRLIAVLPIAAAIFFGLAPPQLAERMVRTFDFKDPTVRDRMAMVHVGERMIEKYPLTGVGPNMVQARYAEFRGPDAVNAVNPHLHNNPLQIAAERGLPALLAWIWFMAALTVDIGRRHAAGRHRFLTAAALATIAALVTAGLFEYNFGDSEVLMLFLILVTLPAAADRSLKSEV